MLSMEDSMSIKILYKQGYSKKAISRKLGISINTVRKYLQLDGLPGYAKRTAKPKKIDAYRDYIKTRVNNAYPHWIPATVIYREIRARGYVGGMTRLRMYLKELKPVVHEEKLIRFETLPGEQMQVDWAELSRGKNRLSAFIATLGYSRMSYVEFVTDERLETLIRCHENAFAYFGGVPFECLYDNMRTIITRRNAYGPGAHRLQQGFWDFSKHCGFMPRVCKPYRAQTKGKVERFIHYFKYSFYYPLQGELKAQGIPLDKEIANLKVMQWLNEVANQRVHGTTQNIPFARFGKEQDYLQIFPGRYSGIGPAQATHLTSSNDAKETLPTHILQHNLSTYEQLFSVNGVN